MLCHPALCGAVLSCAVMCWWVPGSQGTHHRHMAPAKFGPAAVPADCSRGSARLLCRAGGLEGWQEEAVPAQGEGEGGCRERARARAIPTAGTRRLHAAFVPFRFGWGCRGTNGLCLQPIRVCHTAAVPSDYVLLLLLLLPLLPEQANGAITEVEPLCVLDFYVHESHQRQGVGKALFEVLHCPALQWACCSTSGGTGQDEALD